MQLSQTQRAEESNITESWKAIEESIVYPYKLKHLVFSGVSLRQCKSRFGPIVTHLLSTWRDVERRSQLVTKWHRHSPIFHNNNLLSGSTPFHCPQWTHNKVNTLGEIYDDSSLKSFQNLKTQYNLPGTSFFMYLLIRSGIWGAVELLTACSHFVQTNPSF